MANAHENKTRGAGKGRDSGKLGRLISRIRDFCILPFLLSRSQEQVKLVKTDKNSHFNGRCQERTVLKWRFVTCEWMAEKTNAG